MRRPLLLLTALPCLAVIIDRTAIVVGSHAIKDSDIQRDIRITSFLNGREPDFGASSRKQAANRLIDQELIRDQMRTSKYVVAPGSEAGRLLDQTKQDRFANEAQYKRRLEQLEITEAELKDRLSWQLTVLRYIDTRFRPSVVVSDEDIHQYYSAHRAELEAAHPEATAIEDFKPHIEQQIAGERINKLLDDWLEQSRKQIRIDYLEKALQ